MTASRLRQEQQRHTKSIQALRASLWHRFQERVNVLQKFGYLTLATQLTIEGEWARLIRIDHSLLITELIRAEAFTGGDPSLLAGILASLAHDDDRPGAFPRISAGLSSLLGQVRKLAESLSPYEDPPLLRADVAALVERWVADPTLTWIGLCRLTTMAEGDIYRLLARTLEFLSQVQALKSTHPGLAESASQRDHLDPTWSIGGTAIRTVARFDLKLIIKSLIYRKRITRQGRETLKPIYAWAVFCHTPETISIKESGLIVFVT